jgi:hypothetical protein
MAPSDRGEGRYVDGGLAMGGGGGGLDAGYCEPAVEDGGSRGIAAAAEVVVVAAAGWLRVTGGAAEARVAVVMNGVSDAGGEPEGASPRDDSSEEESSGLEAAATDELKLDGSVSKAGGDGASDVKALGANELTPEAMAGGRQAEPSCKQEENPQTPISTMNYAGQDKHVRLRSTPREAAVVEHVAPAHRPQP